MKLKTFLDTHQKFTHRGSLADNLGDGYLLEHNLIYQNVRKAALEKGVKYSSIRFCDYDVLPLTQLPKILTEKTVPYLPNVNALLEIEKAIPDHFGLNDTPPLRANYVHHETAHCLARILRFEHLGAGPSGASLKNLEAQRELALLIMLEEAFANATESMLSAYSEKGIHDDFLLRNTYIFEEPNTRKNMKAVIKMFGLAASFKMILFSFLFANFQKQKASSTELKRVMAIVFKDHHEKFIKLGDRDFNLLREVFQGGFDLDPEFTTRTNGFCLALMGVTANPKTLFSFDFLKNFEKDFRFIDCLDRMGEVVESGSFA